MGKISPRSEVISIRVKSNRLPSLQGPLNLRFDVCTSLGHRCLVGLIPASQLKQICSLHERPQIYKIKQIYHFRAHYSRGVVGHNQWKFLLNFTFGHFPLLNVCGLFLRNAKRWKFIIQLPWIVKFVPGIWIMTHFKSNKMINFHVNLLCRRYSDSLQSRVIWSQTECVWILWSCRLYSANWFLSNTIQWSVALLILHKSLHILVTEKASGRWLDFAISKKIPH